MIVIPSAEKVRRELEAHGWGIQEAARRSKLSRPTITRLVKGRPVAMTSALKLALALAGSPQPLLRIVGDRP